MWTVDIKYVPILVDNKDQLRSIFVDVFGLILWTFLVRFGRHLWTVIVALCLFLRRLKLWT
jgi:hypothetical protein